MRQCSVQVGVFLLCLVLTVIQNRLFLMKEYKCRLPAASCAAVKSTPAVGLMVVSVNQEHFETKMFRSTRPTFIITLEV